MFSFPVKSLEQINEQYYNNYNFTITSVSSTGNPKNNTILFCKRLKEDTVKHLSALTECIILVPKRQTRLIDSLKENNFVVGTVNPRLEYARILQYILEHTGTEDNREPVCLATSIGKNFIMGKGTIIEKNVIIGDDVHIGENCIIKPGAIINSNVTIGNHTIIRENTVIGGYGFGFERDEQGIPIRIPHVGGVVIGNYVEIGAMTTIVAGTIEPTIIDDYTKIDDHVHIAHNCHIGKGCLITACAEVSGSVKIGEFSWLGPNCSIINGISIGKDCFIGIGAVVKKSVADGLVVSGDPARSLEAIKEEKDLIKQLLTAYHSGKLIVTE
ncbi:MAG: UDP-3-O-(3-hydroxymyristoyl) glucosamine N-acyltransferase [Firmicutes bacterium]|nr:UDP-3-O-(3-hydroxymyristoyl) glucosamine N-acyltransferase [Bacillota bacterium]